MYSGSYLSLISPNYTVALPRDARQVEVIEESPASIIDDLAAQYAGKNMIPDTGITMSPSSYIHTMPLLSMDGGAMTAVSDSYVDRAPIVRAKRLTKPRVKAPVRFK
jgi:hypothetical protein